MKKGEGGALSLLHVAAVYDRRTNPAGKRISHFSASIFLTSKQETVRKMESRKWGDEQIYVYGAARCDTRWSLDIFAARKDNPEGIE